MQNYYTNSDMQLLNSLTTANKTNNSLNNKSRLYSSEQDECDIIEEYEKFLEDKENQSSCEFFYKYLCLIEPRKSIPCETEFIVAS